MKNLKFLSLLVFAFVFFTSCDKKESEENKPEESKPVATAEPRIDLIRKVIRYDASGGIEDSVIFQYDSQNRVSQIEYGSVVNGNFQNKVVYVDSLNQFSKKRVEKNYKLETNGQYKLLFTMFYNLNSASKIVSISRMNGNNLTDKQYNVNYDSLDYAKSITEIPVKSGSWFSDINFTTVSSNRISARTHCDPCGHDLVTYEYYSSPYNHNLFTGIYEEGFYLFWNTTLINQLDFRNSLFGKRSSNLVKRQIKDIAQTGTTEINYEYEFNSLGLVSKIKTATVSSINGSTPMATKYEIFYY